MARTKFLGTGLKTPGLALLCVAALCGTAHANEISGLQQAIMQETEDYLAEQAATIDGTPTINVSTPKAQSFETCHDRVYFLPNKGTLRSSMSVGIRCMDSGKTEYLRASLSIEGNYYVASQNIDIGQTLMPNHIEEKQGDLLKLPANSRTTPEQLLGHIANTRIPAGRPIKLNMIRSPQSISKGQPVRLQVRQGALTVTQQGEALTTADVGGSIQVKTGSGKVIMGTVINANTVNVLF
ncbi:flagellar basal body P-ring formation chaperone FlgA [Advenella alkanexedens]|uniref:flagellar basal body P-ring formation chaperone FlgA n=1 Tax=Advenella alkanexedens TaxID=1481665 RepID=UPI0026744DD8|nr:flagellar basal body P-ring formation chaperone FlgA [Advenella alkanexedens]WKU18135.1 flagellar basal body P-ring formation chaperone FlgA [Advenella alkanexedens]